MSSQPTSSQPMSSETMSYQTLRFEVADSIATITIDRPDDANALNARMAAELHDVALRCADDAGVRAVIVTGNGRMFCAGGDLKDMHAQGDGRHAYITRMATDLHNALARFTHMDAPVVMAVNGTAAGAGFSLALAGDYVIATDQAKFVSAYTAAGLTPDGSSTYYLAKHVGLLRAKELMFTNRVLSADEACAWGIVNRVVAGEKLMDEARKTAASFAAGPTRAYGELKGLLLTAYAESFETQLDKETRAIAGMQKTHDGPHGIESFLNKRKPDFKGR